MAFYLAGDIERTQVVAGYSFWAKDIVFVVSDGYLDGMQAWLSAYHGAPQSSKGYSFLDCLADFWLDLVAGPLTLPSGVIWTALSIDYPGHSFSHLGVFFGLFSRVLICSH